MTFTEFLDLNFPTRLSDEHATFTIEDMEKAYNEGYIAGGESERNIWVKDDEV